MTKVSTKKVVLNGLMIALVFVVTRFTGITTPVGYFNLGDVVIIITGVFLGRNSGFLAGSIGSALADLSLGYGVFAPVTFIVKGLEGYVVGLIAHSEDGKKSGEFFRITAAVAGAVVMVAGYFLAEAYIMGLYDKSFGMAAAIKDLTTTNIAQGSMSAVLGYILSTALSRSGIRKYILN